MPIEYRPPRAHELERAEGLVIRSINDLTERHGFGRIASLRPPAFQSFSLEDDPDGLWLAEEAGEIVGFAFSWVCGDLWFLAELFVLPDGQGHGVGHELLKRTLEHGRNAGATNQALITFAFNTVSQGLYVRHGLFPRTPIYSCSVARDRLMSRLQPQPVPCVPVDGSDAHLNRLAEIDLRALGVSRRKHHRYLMGDSAIKGFIINAGDGDLGYVYVSAGGQIGPMAVAEPGDVDVMFGSALGLAAQSGSQQISAFIPGTATAILSVAVEHGMRITFPMLLMSARDFGDWRCYLPRNPGFM